MVKAACPTKILALGDALSALVIAVKVMAPCLVDDDSRLALRIADFFFFKTSDIFSLPIFHTRHLSFILYSTIIEAKIKQIGRKNQKNCHF